jgi:cysteine desulfuration protein SufE
MEIGNSTPATIEVIQQEIVEEFSFLSGDRESAVFYLMDLGRKLPAMDSASKIEENIIKGCQSKVWLTAKHNGQRVFYQADSNTDITKGLISLLVRVLSGQTTDDILNAELSFIHDIGMGQIIGSQRSNGLLAMIKQMKLYALAFKSKEK